MTSHIDLDALTLAKGAHEIRGDGVCLLEAVAWWAHEPHSDHPACVSPVLAAFGRSWNDALPDDRRHILKPFIPLLPGTAGDGLGLARSYLALDWLARECAPAFLDLTPALAPHAAALRGLPRLQNPETVQSAEPLISAARDATGAAARDAAGAAARAAAWDAAWAAARAAAWAAARAAAGDALAPTVLALQESALSLYRAMLHPAPEEAS